MEAAGPLFYSFSDFELVLIAAFANQIANANIVLDGHRRICVVLVDGTSARSTIEFFVGMNHDVAMPVLRWGVRRILLLDEIVFLHFMALHYSLFSFAIISQIVVLNKKAVLLDTLPRLKSWDSTSTRPLAVPVLRLSVTAWCPTRRSIFTQGSPFGLIPCGIY